MIAIHQEFIGSFSEHEDDILSTQAENDDDNDPRVCQLSLKEYYGLGCNSWQKMNVNLQSKSLP